MLGGLKPFMFSLWLILGNIKRYQLLKKEKWATLLLHLSFIFFILGAFVTRYISYEGMQRRCRWNQIFSDKTFLTVFVDGEFKGEMKRRTYETSSFLSCNG
jgi:cytochrome c biogenesis factor